MAIQKMQRRPTIGSDEAGAIVGVSRDTIRRWAKAGRVRHVLLPSGRMRFYREDIEALLEPVEPVEPVAAAREVDEGPFVDAPLPALEDEAVAV